MRYLLVRLTVTLAMLAGLLLSWKLWLTDRGYPHVPVWDGLPIVPAPWDRALLGTLLFVLGLSLGLSRPRWGLLGFVAMAGLWSLWDQTRWQPWFYQYLFVLTALALADSPDDERRESGLCACRFIVAATYFWSGLQKVNVTFATDVFPWMLEPVLKWVPESLGEWLKGQGWYAAFLEAGLGAALLFRPTRLPAVIALLGMHTMILYALSPWGHDWNSVVWPWNVTMMALLLLLFVCTPDLTAWRILRPGRQFFRWLVLVLFGVMPYLSLHDAWDAYLSASLYSGNTLSAKVEIDSEAAFFLPPEVRTRYVRFTEVDLFDWAIDELNVPPYPARRVYRGIARELIRRTGSPDGVHLTIQERPDWRTGSRALTPEVLPEQANTASKP